MPASNINGMVKIKPPPLECAIGIECYRSERDGVGGQIKTLPEDFVVEEVSPQGIVLEVNKPVIENNAPGGSYTHFTLQKKNWETMRALKELSERLRVSRERFGYAGTKDKRALTTQRVSVRDVPIESLVKVRVRDIVLKDFCYSNDEIVLGQLAGNRFTLTIRGIDLKPEEAKDSVEQVAEELEGLFPNYYGLQRFGVVRPITHLVGKAILKGDFKKAVFTYIAEVFDGEEEESKRARKLLHDTGDVKEALRVFPKHLGYETAMLNYLAVNPEDYVGAIRTLPRSLQWMFVHAYQAYVFNRALSRYTRDGRKVYALPLAGCKSVLDDVTKETLMEDGITQEDFTIRKMPELSSDGELRDCLKCFSDFKVLDASADEVIDGKTKMTLRFSLDKGSYATILVREFMKNQYWRQDFYKDNT